MGLFIITAFIAVLATVESLPLNFAGKSGCLVDLNDDLTYQHPLILKPNSTEFVLPGSNGIKLNIGDKIQVVCTGKGNYIKAGEKKSEKILECENSNIFKVQGEESSYFFKEITCNNYPEPVARKTGKKCAEKYTEIELGFNVSSGFVRTILVCFDEARKNSLYSTYLLMSSIDKQQIKVPRPGGFIEGEFYPNMYPRPSSLYTSSKELTAFTYLLRSEDLAKKYIKVKNSDFFLSRGHLTAKADFLYGSQQRSTFFYVNVAPQWQIINGKNWNSLEQDVRSFAAKRGSDLIVYTGVWGTSTLPDKNEKETQLYLYVDKDVKYHLLTVPELYWKILYDPETKDGVAFVTHNNPYETDVAKKTICKNICNKINWLNWRADNITLGYSYCCEVYDLKKTVSYIPEFDIQGLLM